MATPWSGYLDDVSAKFDTGVDNLQTQVTEALDKLAAKPSDPALLAAYQVSSRNITCTVTRNRTR